MKWFDGQRQRRNLHQCAVAAVRVTRLGGNAGVRRRSMMHQPRAASCAQRQRVHLATALMAAILSAVGRAQDGQCTRTGEDSEAGVNLFGLPNCPCLVQDAPNGFMAAAPDIPTACVSPPTSCTEPKRTRRRCLPELFSSVPSRLVLEILNQPG